MKNEIKNGDVQAIFIDVMGGLKGSSGDDYHPAFPEAIVQMSET